MPLSPAVRADHEFAGGLTLVRRRIQVGVARDLAARGGDEVPGAVVAQVQNPVFRQRCHAVGQARRFYERQDLADLGGGEFGSGDLRPGHRAAVAVWSLGPLARSSAAALSPLTGTNR